MDMKVEYKDYQPDENGCYGPTSKNKLYYKPNPVHNPQAGKKTHKSQWCKSPSEQYCIFEKADANNLRTEKGYLGMDIEDQQPLVLGAAGEIIAIFHSVQNEGDPWHGNPEKVKRLDNSFDVIIEKLKSDKTLTKSFAKKILSKQI